jgi:hypothetical protein
LVKAGTWEVSSPTMPARSRGGADSWARVAELAAKVRRRASGADFIVADPIVGREDLAMPR